LRVHHFPVRSAEQFARKVGFKADGKPRDRMSPAQRDWVRILEEEGEAAIAARYREEYWFADPDEAGLVLDPCP
jgi:hypothetical protein